MSRIKVPLPDQFAFTTTIPIRITDINYGGHVGNDTILSLVHEARMLYLKQHGLSEMEFAGVGLIMSDAAIEFRSELFYGDLVIASVTIANQARFSFDLFYKLEKETEGKRQTIAAVKTGMVCYDYKARKISPFPEAALVLNIPAT